MVVFEGPPFFDAVQRLLIVSNARETPNSRTQPPGEAISDSTSACIHAIFGALARSELPAA